MSPRIKITRKTKRKVDGKPDTFRVNFQLRLMDGENVIRRGSVVVEQNFAHESPMVELGKKLRDKLIKFKNEKTADAVIEDTVNKLITDNPDLFVES